MSLNPNQMIERYGTQVDLAIRNWFANNTLPAPMYAMAEYHLGWRNPDLTPSKARQGKMLRPLLCILTYEIFNPAIEDILPFAAACELYHNHTLVLDDIQDGDKLRRDRPTVWSLWGIGQGINAGLFLGYLSQSFLLQLSKERFPSRKLFLLLDAYTRMTFELAEGQSLDLDFESKQKVTSQDYLEMIGKKTGALISLCTYGGALLGQDDPETSEKFQIFGRKLGVAMQIRDDLIGIWGSTEQSGKEMARDIWRKKKTFPVLKAFDLLKGNKLNVLQKYYSSSAEPDAEIVGQLVRALEQEGVRENTIAAASNLLNEAFSILHQTKIPAERMSALESFANHAYNSIGTLRQVASKT